MNKIKLKEMTTKYQWLILLINTLPITLLLFLGLFIYLRLEQKKLYDIYFILKSGWGFFMIIGIDFTENPLFSILSIISLTFLLLTNFIQFYFSPNKLVKIITVMIFVFILVTICYSFYSEYFYTSSYN